MKITSLSWTTASAASAKRSERQGGADEARESAKALAQSILSPKEDEQAKRQSERAQQMNSLLQQLRSMPSAQATRK